jgi:glycosyltransferase involved in cell wall biosynthesis
MFISGFTFVRNAIKYDYPITEAIRSLLPLCDEVVVAVGQSDDETLALVESIRDPRIRIIHTIWDDDLRTGGQVLATETNKAMDAVSPKADWCIYIQADEVIHEASHAAIKAAMQTHLANQKVEGFLFDFTHFYGSYQYVGTARRWYRREVRIIRNDQSIRSWKDAQGFRRDGQKLQVAHCHGQMFHYGWVKHPAQQQQKQRFFHTLWHDASWLDRHIGNQDRYQYDGSTPLTPFAGTHPAVMHDRVAAMNWTFKVDQRTARGSIKERLSAWFERLTGWRVGEYRNYREL